MELSVKEWILENGGYPDLNSKRYKGRELYEDRVNYDPVEREPRLYTVVVNYDQDIRRKGKLSIDKAIELYPIAKYIEYRIKDTGKLYKRLRL